MAILEAPTLTKARDADPQAFLQRAKQLAEAGQMGPAISACRMLVHVNPQHVEANYNMAALLLNAGKPRPALAYAMTLMELQPDNPLYRLTYAAILHAVGFHRQAKSKLLDDQAAGQLKPLNDNLRQQIDAALKSKSAVKPLALDLKAVDDAQSEGRDGHAKAEDLLIAMSYRAQDTVALWERLFSNTIIKKDFLLAEAAARRMVALLPDKPDPYAYLGHLHEAMGEVAFAEQIFSDCLNRYDATSEIVLQYGALLERQGKARNADADALLERYSDLVHGHSRLVCLAAQIKDMSGQFDKSAAFIEEAIDLCTDNFSDYHRLFVLLSQQSKRDLASRLVDKAERQFGLTAGVRALKVLAHDMNGEAEAAIEHAEELPKMGAQLIYSLAGAHAFAAARAYDKLGRFDDAFATYGHANQVRRAEFNADFRYNPAGVIATCDALEQSFKNDTSGPWPRRDSLPELPRQGFIYGLPRSGTTLLDTLLRAHPEMSLFEEEPILWPALGEFRAKKENWARLAQLSQEEIHSAQRKYLEIATQIAGRELTPSDFIIDRHPFNTSYVSLAERFFPDAKHIFIVRHPLDVILSGFRQDFVLSDAMCNNLQIDTGAKYYDAVMRSFTAGIESKKTDVHFVKYEDLVSDTEAEMRKILKHLDVDWYEGVLDTQKTAKSRERIRTASKDQVTQPIHTKARYHWRNYRKHLEPVIPTVQRWIDYFGYPLD